MIKNLTNKAWWKSQFELTERVSYMVMAFYIAFLLIEAYMSIFVYQDHSMFWILTTFMWYGFYQLERFSNKKIRKFLLDVAERSQGQTEKFYSLAINLQNQVVMLKKELYIEKSNHE